MSDGATLQRLALALEGVSSASHFDRTAFKAKRNFVTLAADGLGSDPSELMRVGTPAVRALSPPGRGNEHYRLDSNLKTHTLTANFRFSPDEHALKCAALPDAFSPVPNAWGQQGWTLGVLSKLSEDDLTNALEIAWRHAQAVPRQKAKRIRS